ncbi:amino acid transporter [Scopulibacillus darangshiensis]|uniref:Amino acid transporter n=1 Tax=Scopulibacillus darangshiensis TaxID=442528 RepID=A0A4R2P974_9BACL|nr:APC family permease [Scopulibacillus darangshiensis]TCP30888.1 amino acid transporter [Scopulibacillus darangshiensis]
MLKNNTDSKNGKQELKKVLKTRDLVIFGIIFISPNSAQSLFGGLTTLSHGHGVLAIFVGLIAMIFTAFSYGKMASVIPKAGSTYSYATHTLHPTLGFMAGWAILLDYLIFPMLVYKLSSSFAIEMMPFMPLWLMLIIFILPMTLFNYVGMRVSSHLNLIMLLLKLISVFLFVGFAIHALTNGVGTGKIIDLQGVFDSTTFSMNALISGSSIAVLSYIGFDAITALSEDAKVPGKTVGRAVIITCLVSSALIGIQIYFATLIHPNFATFKNTDTAFYEVAIAAGGSGLAAATTILLVVTGAASALAGQASGSRVLFSMGRDQVLPGFLSYLHPKYKTPVYSILILAVLGYVGALLIPISVFFLIVVFGALIGFIFVNLSVVIEFFIKRKERKGANFLSNLISPILGIVVCIYILIGMDLVGKIVGICWLLVGFLYLTLKTKGFKQQVKMDM